MDCRGDQRHSVGVGLLMGALLMTIGYEGRDLQEFEDILRGANVEVLVDVREKPLSRKRGFAKSALQGMLEGIGKSYVHLRGLGSPSELRMRLHEGSDYDGFFAEFDALLDSPERDQYLEYVAGIVRGGKAVCLMCFERDSRKCHRSILAKRLVKKLPGVKVLNL